VRPLGRFLHVVGDRPFQQAHDADMQFVRLRLRRGEGAAQLFEGDQLLARFIIGHNTYSIDDTG
jgi:hypothetical protein